MPSANSFGDAFAIKFVRGLTYM